MLDPREVRRNIDRFCFGVLLTIPRSSSSLPVAFLSSGASSVAGLVEGVVGGLSFFGFKGCALFGGFEEGLF